MNWTDQQLEAIEKSGMNIIVSAGAGSGKTAVLTERVINKVKNGININELLILTFTNNAAHEMKERIRKALIKNNLSNQIDLIDEAYITTFDSFTLSIVKKYHYLLNISKNVNITDESIIYLIKNDIINNIFETKYKEKDKEFLNLINSFCVKNDNEIKNNILNIYKKIELLCNKEQYLNDYVVSHYDKEYLDDIFKEYEKIVLGKKNEILYLLDALKQEVDNEYYNKIISAISDLLDSNTYEEMRGKQIKIPNLPKGTSDKSKELKTQLKKMIDNINEMTIQSKEELITNYKKTNLYTKELCEILTELDQELSKYKSKYNMYGFNDIALLGIDLIKKNKTVKDSLKNSFKEIMIDEYQDTSDIQETFVSYISNNNLYMVGDIKQSIYRFRNANPYIFKLKYDNYSKNIGGYKIDLAKNFRSRKEVLEDINKIFDLIMDDNIGGANYKDTHRMIFGNNAYVNEGKIKHNTNLEIYKYDKNKYTNAENEAFIIANDIKSKIKNKYQVFDGADLRNCEYRDFAILLDRGTDFNTYKKIFDYLNIKINVFKDENIINETEILLIKNIITIILKIKDHNYDNEFKYCMTSILRSYLFDFNDEDIFLMHKQNKLINNKPFEICKNISDEIDSLSNKEIIYKIIYDFDFYKNIIKVGNVNNKTIILEKMLENAEELNNLGQNIFQLKDYFESLIKEKKEIKISLNKGDKNSVNLLTIHKSKGLEYKICYYAGFDKKFNELDLNNKIMYDNKYGIITPYLNEGINDTFIKYLVKENYKIEDISERIRLFYVALTRCKEKMIIVSSVEANEEINDKIINFNIRKKYKSFKDILYSLIGNLDNSIKIVDNVLISKDYLYEKNREFKIDNNDKNTRNIIISDINIKNNVIEQNSFSKKTNNILTIDEIKNIKQGLKIHEMFEIEDFKTTKNEMVLNLLNHIDDIENAKIYKEYEFIYTKDNKEYHGIIDLLLIYDNYVKIIDYKLKNIKDKQYDKQLLGYKEYIEKILKKPATTYLYSILDDEMEMIN